MNHLLIISYPFPPNASAGAVRSERFARYLAKSGWKIDVITIQPRLDLFEDKNRLNNLGENVTVHFTTTFDPWLWLRDKRPENLMVRAIRSVLMRLFSFPDHMLLWMPFALKKALSIHKKNRFDAIYTTSPPHSTHLIGLLLSKLTGKPWVADFRDPWTLNAYRGKGKIENILLWIERKLEKTIYVNSSAIFVNTKANKENMLKAFPFIEKDKVIHLPNGWEEFAENNIDGEKKNEQLIIVHAGTFYPKFKPYALFYALSAWHNGDHPKTIPPLNKSNIQIILLGTKDDTTKKLIVELGLEKFVVIKPWVAQAEAQRYMRQADLLLASLGTGQESATYVPSKLFEYIAAGKPIIGFFPEGEAASLIRETGTGIIFTSDDPAPIIKTLNRLQLELGSSHQVNTLCHRREDVIASYHIGKITGRLAEILNQIVSVSQY